MLWAFLVAPVQCCCRLTRKGVVGHIGFQTATLTAAAKRPVELHLGVTQFKAKVLRAAIDFVVHHKTHAHPVLDGDHGKIRKPAPGAEPQFRKGHQIGIIVHPDRQADPLGRQ